MIESGNFNIISTSKPANESLIVAFSPSKTTASYTYTIYKDENEYKTVTINNNETTNIYLKETGTYQINVLTTDINGITNNVNSGTYIIDKVAPIIKVEEKEINIYKDGNINQTVTATDNRDGDITSKITSNIDELNLSETGTQTLTYKVSDEAGNTVTQNVTINIIGSNVTFLTVQSIIIASLLIILYFILKFRKTLNLEKRLDKYTIKPLKNNAPSLMDNMVNTYHKVLNKMNKVLEKSVFAKKYAEKLEKYACASSLHDTGMEILSGKILTSLLLVIIAIFSKTLSFDALNIYELVIPLIIGFFLLDIIYFIKYKYYRNKIENDLLSAIIVMNNAFKSGRSITQAIDIVSSEIEGPIGKEFAKMSIELSYGLSIEDVFRRFGKRVDLEEVNYLTASLTILNKTGGNIIEVFSSIEKNMFNKKKLRLELKSLTGSSKIIVYVLLLIPFIFVLMISIISPNYFAPFINTPLGLILLIGMIIYYIIFAVCVRKIMKVVI